MKTRFQFSQVAIATDLRPSSPRIAQACARMLHQLGLEVIFCGPIPTPALALFAQSRRIPGIMVTGSHIPFDRNGLKFYRPDGEITKADEAGMLASTVQPLTETAYALPAVSPDAKDGYMQRYKDLLGTQALSGLKLALYQHSSVGRDLMQQLFSELGAEVICLERSESFVPIDTEAVSAEDMQRGRDWAKQYAIDAIISTDGDGDRPLISDEHGLWLRGDIVGLLTAQALQITHLAVPVSCNTAIEASERFAAVTRTRIGSPYVIAGMEALLAADPDARVAGFEANGGFLLGSTINGASTLQALPTRDAVLPVVTLLGQIKAQGKSLSQLVAALPPRYTASDRLQNFATEKSKALLAEWSQSPDQLLQSLGLQEQSQSVDMTDGLRVSCRSGRIVHLRPSGNAPELRCYAEAESLTAAADIVTTVLKQLATLA